MSFERQLEELESHGLRRALRLAATAQRPRMAIDGRESLIFASNNYLDLAAHEEVIAAAQEAAGRWGVGAGAARLVVGTMGIHRELEQELALFKGTEDCVLFSSGFLANLALGVLVGRGDTVFSDSLNHASIIDGCKLSRAEVTVYPHCDMQALEDKLRAWRDSAGVRGQRRMGLVVTDSVFSMDGDLAPLDQIVDLCERYGVMLMADEAHATGVVGPGGRGAVSSFGLSDRVKLIMGTLSKSLGSAGGFLCGSHALCELLRNKARSYMFDTAPSPMVVAGALAALRVIQREPQRVEKVRSLTQQLANALNVPDVAAAIVPVVIGDARKAVELSTSLLEQGLLVPAIRPPAVPAGTARLRITLTAGHSESDVAILVGGFSGGRGD